MNFDSNKNQQIKRKFVEREVIQCVSYLVSHFLQNTEALTGSNYDYEDLMDLCVQNINTVCADQFRYVIDHDERGEFRATVYDIDEEGDDNNDIYNFKLENQEEFEQMGEEIDDLSNLNDVESYLKEHNIIPEHATLIDEYDVPETEEETHEAYEHWVVTDWLARKLDEKDEITGELFGLTIWGRCTSGQAILLDCVIGEICSDLEILEGQKHEWEV